MVDPRIYRAGLALVAIAVIIFGFSLQSQPGPDTTTLVAPGYSGPSLASLDTAYPDRAPGSPGDLHFAAAVAQALRTAVGGASGFTVTSSEATLDTGAGRRTVTTVAATRTGLTPGTIVIVSDRDAPGQAGVSSTAVLIGLAHALAGSTQHHPILLVSTSGQVGSAGADALARSLVAAGQPIDAVLALGDLAAAHVSHPLVVPFGSDEGLAPPVLTRTVTHYLTLSAGLSPGSVDPAGQLAHLAVPLTLTDQGPFDARGIPAVLLSLSGTRLTQPGEAVAAGRPAAMFDTVYDVLSSLDGAPEVPAPSAYGLLSGHVVPAWAVRLLVLVLILPVGLATVDALARARRRGHSILHWLAWTLGSAIPFLGAVAIVRLARVTGALSATPPGATGAGGVPLGAAGAAVMAMAAVACVAAFAWLRPLVVRAAVVRLDPAPRRPGAGDEHEAAGVGLSIVMCATTLVLWLLDPFAALLLVPALHAWLWLAQPGVRARAWAPAALVVIGAAPGALVAVYYGHAFGMLSPLHLAWMTTLLVAGGALPIAAAIYWSVALGCLAAAMLIAVRAARGATAQRRIEPAVTVRGPANYAGPGSLGGTESALRR